MTRDQDDKLDAALNTWANAQSPTQPDFIEALSAIPAQHRQQRHSVWSSIFMELGGWRFLGPQLAGVVVAALLGVSVGAGSFEAAEDDYTVMSDHIFGSEETWEDAV